MKFTVIDVPKNKNKWLGVKRTIGRLSDAIWSDIIELDYVGYKGAVATLESFQCNIMNYMHFSENH